MSTITLAPGQVFRGPNKDYEVSEILRGDGSHISIVAKAAVTPHDDKADQQHPRWAVIKLAASKIAQKGLQREIVAYALPGVSSARCFRQHYPLESENTMALEWLDLTLANLLYKPSRPVYNIIKAVLHTCLLSYDILADQKHVNTDIKPANILLSTVRTNCKDIIAKVGDLGSDDSALNQASRHEADTIECQPVGMRAPEVWLHHGCTMAAQVWSVAAMSLVWMKPGFFGEDGEPIISCPEEVEDKDLEQTMNDAMAIYTTPKPEEEQLQEILPFDKEIQKVNMRHELRSLLLIMLATDPKKRPSSSDVLASAEYQAFVKFVDGLYSST
ncbi:d901e2b7-67f1-46d5-91ea-b0fac1d47d0f [Sclerotinia trifoliorum]|uniref:D901e2b7-67f1-46d5-91ea-b0fac1d47d0f n=1 Tax=Sclerotinia trifoliorum TaxID=28548 RepID=A0A8H2W482_9HELO|nr:d901e2b7-67f1-46d5-91ea-b0fac1d47d0f [Sclerotinia trifoliorum]